MFLERPIIQMKIIKFVVFLVGQIEQYKWSTSVYASIPQHIHTIRVELLQP